jgi:hypothetical protein
MCGLYTRKYSIIILSLQSGCFQKVSHQNYVILPSSLPQPPWFTLFVLFNQQLLWHTSHLPWHARFSLTRPSLFLLTSNRNKIGKAYSLEYTNIPEMLFTPHHVGCSCTNVITVQCCIVSHSCTVIQGHCCILHHSCTNMIQNHCCSTVSSNNDLRFFCSNVMRSHCSTTMGIFGSHCCPTIDSNDGVESSRQTDMTSPYGVLHSCQGMKNT